MMWRDTATDGMWLPSLDHPSSVAVVPETETTALLARITATPDATRQGVINTLIKSLKAGGVWTSIDRLYILAAADSQSALLNWVSTSYPGVLGGTPPTFTANQGYTGDGAAALITTGALAAPITANNLAMGLWVRNNVAENKADMGGGAVEIRSRAASSLMSSRLVDASANSGADVTTSVGWTMATIDPANTANKVFYKGTNVETASFARTTITTLPATTQSICGVTASSFSTKQIAAAVWAQNLTAAQNTALCNAIAAYMSAIGA